MTLLVLLAKKKDNIMYLFLKNKDGRLQGIVGGLEQSLAI
jgi:hypothetical protein